MDKEEILQKSRNENQGRDLYEDEVMTEGGYIGALVAVVVATIFFVIQISIGAGRNYGLYAVVASVLATYSIVKAIRLKRKRETFAAVVCTLVTLACFAAHIYQLMTIV